MLTQKGSDFALAILRNLQGVNDVVEFTLNGVDFVCGWDKYGYYIGHITGLTRDQLFLWIATMAAPQ